jgi:succinyl-CoA synthetase alpha subunit
VSPDQVLDAAREAMQAGIRRLVLMTRGVPPLDMVQIVQAAESCGALVVGANSPGLIRGSCCWGCIRCSATVLGPWG